MKIFFGILSLIMFGLSLFGAYDGMPYEIVSLYIVTVLLFLVLAVLFEILNKSENVFGYRIEECKHKETEITRMRENCHAIYRRIGSKGKELKLILMHFDVIISLIDSLVSENKKEKKPHEHTKSKQ